MLIDFDLALEVNEETMNAPFDGSVSFRLYGVSIFSNGE